jgi:hypothetical protein
LTWAYLFAIDPVTLDVNLDSSITDPAELMLSRHSIAHLPRPPAAAALDWRFQRWLAR